MQRKGHGSLVLRGGAELFFYLLYIFRSVLICEVNYCFRTGNPSRHSQPLFFCDLGEPREGLLVLSPWHHRDCSPVFKMGACRQLARLCWLLSVRSLLGREPGPSVSVRLPHGWGGVPHGGVSGESGAGFPQSTEQMLPSPFISKPLY